MGTDFAHKMLCEVVTLQNRAAEPMSRVLKMAHGKISLACGIHCPPIFFFV
jgi:hypothetical protein